MKRQVKIKFIAAAVLILAALILFYIYVSPDDESLKVKSTDQEVKPFVKNRINRQIDSIIYTFGIRKEWIFDSASASKQLKNKSNRDLIYKEVFIPSDLPVIDLNYEISGFLRANNLVETATEDAKGKNLTINFYLQEDTAGKQAGILKFVSADSVKRNAAEICLVLDSIEYYNLSEVKNMIGSTQEYSVFLPLGNDKADFQSNVIDAKRDFLIKISAGNEDDVDADFKTDMNESVWKSKVRALYLNFSQAGGVILNDNPGLNEFENNIAEEFKKNNMSVYKDTMFIKFKQGENLVASLFKDIIYRSGAGKKTLFYTVNFSPEEFDEYDSQVYTLKKQGYKFYDFKELIKKEQ